MRTPSPVHGPALLGLGLLLVAVGLLPVLRGGEPAATPAAAAGLDPTAGTASESASEPVADPAVDDDPVTEPPTEPPNEPSESAAAVEHQDVVDFYAGFNAAVAAADVATLYDLLHPLVFERYGTEQCRSYLDEFGDEPFEVEVLGSEPPAAWVWELDGERTEVDPAIQVQVRLSVGEASVEQEVHLAVADGELRWFTDCGDPGA